MPIRALAGHPNSMFKITFYKHATACPIAFVFTGELRGIRLQLDYSFYTVKLHLDNKREKEQAEAEAKGKRGDRPRQRHRRRKRRRQRDRNRRRLKLRNRLMQERMKHGFRILRGRERMVGTCCLYGFRGAFLSEGHGTAKRESAVGIPPNPALQYVLC